MNKLTILFLTMLLTCLPMAMRAESHKEKRDDTRYLAGAVFDVAFGDKVKRKIPKKGLQRNRSSG